MYVLFFVFGVNKSYAKHAWHENSEGIWYESEDDKGNYIYFTNGWKKIDSKYYYFNKAGYVLTGKNKINGKYYYLNKPKGYRIENQWVGDYYFGKDGVMLTNTTTPDGYRVDKNGRWITDRWLEFSDHWEYMYADGSKAKNKFEKIYEKTYYFNSKGHMVTGWEMINKNWYYFYDSGSMAKNEWVGSYYLGSNGKMLINTITPDGYRVDKNGKWITDRWLEFSDHWEYMYADGSKAKNKFEKIYEKTYYFNSKGHMVTGWEMINKNWYYFYDSGSMAKNEWVGSYYLGSNGKMLINTITPDGYRVNSYGACVGGVWKLQNGYWIYKYDDGAYAKDGWRRISGEWYYFNSNGRLLTNTITPDGYIVDSNGRITTADWYLKNGVITAGNINARVGNDFVVVSLEQQKMWVVRNGDVKVETGIISGKPSTPTVTGIFRVQSKESSRYLVGPGYRSWVAYWIPFWGDYGIHDANWQYRRNFSNNNAYLYYGSHGCINVNPSVMGSVFYYTYIGMPVIVY